MTVVMFLCCLHDPFWYCWYISWKFETSSTYNASMSHSSTNACSGILILRNYFPSMACRQYVYMRLLSRVVFCIDGYDSSIYCCLTFPQPSSLVQQSASPPIFLPMIFPDMRQAHPARFLIGMNVIEIVIRHVGKIDAMKDLRCNLSSELTRLCGATFSRHLTP